MDVQLLLITGHRLNLGDMSTEAVVGLERLVHQGRGAFRATGKDNRVTVINAAHIVTMDVE